MVGGQIQCLYVKQEYISSKDQVVPCEVNIDVFGLRAAVSISIRWERIGDVVAALRPLQDSAFSALQGQFDPVVPCDS